jgi:pimeloyl-ACP methyl ester carboxylesterase
MQPERHNVELTSHGATLRGWLYPATGETPGPGIVMTHGLTAVREMFLDRYAEAFATAGFTTLVYDHFGFGSSDGEPRQWPSPARWPRCRHSPRAVPASPPGHWPLSPRHSSRAATTWSCPRRRQHPTATASCSKTAPTHG